MDTSKILKTIENAIEQLTTLEIVTALGSVNLTETNTDGKTSYTLGENIFQPSAKLMVTRIKLLEGDITTIMPDDFCKPEYEWLRKFHAERENQGLETVQNMLKTMKDLAQFAKDMAKGD